MQIPVSLGKPTAGIQYPNPSVYAVSRRRVRIIAISRGGREVHFGRNKAAKLVTCVASGPRNDTKLARVVGQRDAAIVSTQHNRTKALAAPVSGVNLGNGSTIHYSS